MTRRKQITDKLKLLLDAITIAGGYKTNFPAAKIWSPYVENPSDGFLLVSIKDTVNNFSDQDDATIQTLNVEVTLQCCVKDVNYTTILNMVDDVYKCIYANKHTIQKDLNIIDINPVSDEVGLMANEREFAAAKIIFSIVHAKHYEWIYEAVS